MTVWDAVHKQGLPHTCLTFCALMLSHNYLGIHTYMYLVAIS